MTSPSHPRLTWINQSGRAHELIEQWVHEDPEMQNESLARLIAAALHDGPGTALEQFAATGTLEPQRALDELNRVRVPLEREAWVDALGRFILFTAGVDR